MTGHNSRVLHLAQSPDGVTVCSAAADETLRFWKCFAEAAPTKACAAPACAMHRHAAIRKAQQSTSPHMFRGVQHASWPDCPIPLVLRHNGCTACLYATEWSI